MSVSDVFKCNKCGHDSVRNPCPKCGWDCWKKEFATNDGKSRIMLKNVSGIKKGCLVLENVKDDKQQIIGNQQLKIDELEKEQFKSANEYIKLLQEKNDLEKQNEELIKKLELTLAKVWDNKYEEDKLFLIIDRAAKMQPNKLIEKYKKELGY